MPKTPLDILLGMGRQAGSSLSPKNIAATYKRNKEADQRRKNSSRASSMGKKLVAKFAASALGTKILAIAGSVIGIFLAIVLIAAVASTVAAAAESAVDSVVSTVTFGLLGEDDSELTDEERQELENDPDVQEISDSIAQCLDHGIESPKDLVARTPVLDFEVAEAWSAYSLSITQDTRPMDAVEFSHKYSDLIDNYRRENPDGPQPELADVLDAIEPGYDFSAGIKAMPVMMLALDREDKLTDVPENQMSTYRNDVLKDCNP